MADRCVPTERLAWRPTATHLPPEWIKLAHDLEHQIKNSPHAYVLKVRYDAQRVGDQLHLWGLPWDVVMAGYLWDDDEEMIRIANLSGVDRVLDHIREANIYARYIEDENLPPLLSPPYRDIGALLLAIAIYYQALRTLQRHSNDQPYAPETLSQIENVGRTLKHIATRLGMWHFKREIEDLIECLRNPRKFAEDKQEYTHILKQDQYMLEATRQLMMSSYQEAAQHEVVVSCTQCAVTGMNRRLQDAHTTATSQKTHITGFDLVTFDVVVSTVQECYEAFGIISQLGYIQDRVTDLVANPKPNGCSNIAFGLILKARGPRTQQMSWIETYNYVCQVQISTYVMYAVAWYGCLYPDYYELCAGNASQKFLEPLSGGYLMKSKEGKVFSTIRENFIADHAHFDADAPIIIYDRNRKPFALPKGATALDFAYAVSVEMGEHAVEAFVNNRKSSLYRALEAGDLVEIRTTKEIQAQDYWLQENYAITPLARSHIKESLERRQRDRRGYHLLLQELERYHYMLTPEALDEQLARLVKQHNLGTLKAYLEQLDNTGKPPYTPDWAAQGIIQQMADLNEPLNKSRVNWVPMIDMLPNVPKKSARKQRLCDFCQPRYPHDIKIMGLLRDRSNELVVHKESCPHIIDTVGQRSALLPMTWQMHYPTFRVTFFLLAHDRKGLVLDISRQLHRHPCNFTAIHGEAITEKGDAWVRCTIETYTDTEALDIWQELYQVESVTKVEIDAAHTSFSTREHLQKLSDKLADGPSKGTTQEFLWDELSTIPPRSPILRNLFDISRPASPKMFFGRSEETKMMRRELCEGEHGKALVLYGPRRSGKSSICKNFLERQISRPFWGTLFSLQNLSRHPEEIILAQLTEKIRATFIEQLERSEADWPNYNDSDPQTCFRRILADCITQIPGTRLTVVLDEFGGALEAYEHKILNHRFFTYWKDLMDEIPQLSLIIALPTSSHNLLTREFPHTFSFAESLPMVFLDAESAARLLVDPLRDQNIIIHPPTVTLATKLTGGNPYYITLIGQKLINQLNREREKQLVTDQDLRLVIEQMIEQGSNQNFDYLRDELQCDEEVRILQAIVELTLRTSKVRLKKIADWLNMPAHTVKGHLDRLRIGLILEENGPPSSPYYSFKIELVRQWLTRNGWFFH